MKVLIFGSGGLTGSHLLKILIDNQSVTEIITAGRASMMTIHPKHRHQVIDFEKLGHHSELFGVNSVFCCLGSTMAKAGSKEKFAHVDLSYPIEIAWMAQQHGVKRLIVISSAGADARSQNFYLNTKGKMETGVSGVFQGKLTFMRPGLILGKRNEFRLGEKMAAILFPLFNPMMIGPLKEYRAVSAQLIAAAMLQAALMDNPPRICGSHAIQNLAKQYFIENKI